MDGDSFGGGVGVVSQGAMGTLGGALGRMGSGTPRFETSVQAMAIPGKGQTLPGAGTLEMQLCSGKGTEMGGGIWVRGRD